VNGKLYVFGGLQAPGKAYSFPATTRSDVYDPVSDTWTRLGDMPEAFTHATAEVDGTTIWFVGGYLGDSPGPGTTHVWKYDTLTDSWTRGPDLPAPRGSGATGIVGRTLHYFGGGDEQRVDRSDHWALALDDPQAAWTAKASMPTARNHLAGAVVGGRIYAIGGQVGDMHEAADVDLVEVYDATSDAWTAGPSLPEARSHINCSTLVLNDRILIIGGESPGLQRDILQFDPASNVWSAFALLPDPRSTAIAGAINGALVVATGNSPGMTDDLWIGTLS
jgi:N-acetylneuraminic acid mutarotase